MDTVLKDRKILVVDDESSTLELVGRILESEGYQTEKAPDGRTALKLFEERSPDLVVLDIVMPGIDGLEVCSRIREQSQVPMIIITGLRDDDYMGKCFDLGVADYITKPFGAPELIARIRAVLRRTAPTKRLPGFIYKRDGLEIDAEAQAVLIDGKEVVLSGKEFALLAHLARNAGRVLATNQIIENVWEYDTQDDAHLVRIVMSRLRKKLGDDPREPKYITTRIGVGYMMKEPQS